ncbi:hypothetical protein J6590_065779 [Homalodisca vitripennis]|nr:hypothetical protein J6590_065779 [Homalodisca vitripennis]
MLATWLLSQHVEKSPSGRESLSTLMVISTFPARAKLDYWRGYVMAFVSQRPCLSSPSHNSYCNTPCFGIQYLETASGNDYYSPRLGIHEFYISQLPVEKITKHGLIAFLRGLLSLLL